MALAKSSRVQSLATLAHSTAPTDVTPAIAAEVAAFNTFVHEDHSHTMQLN